MINLVKGYVPEVYSESRDYRVFLRLLSVLISVLKDKVDRVPTLYSSDECPKDLLYLLADMVGYSLDSSRTTQSNRMIISNYPVMLRNRGSRTGLKMAAALSLNSKSSSPSYSLDNILIEYDFDKGLIKIYYPSGEELDFDLIEAVRPVGSRIQYIASTIRKNTEEVDVKVDVFKDTDKWSKERTEVGKSKVGFGDTGYQESSGD